MAWKELNKASVSAALSSSRRDSSTLGFYIQTGGVYFWWIKKIKNLVFFFKANIYLNMREERTNSVLQSQQICTVLIGRYAKTSMWDLAFYWITMIHAHDIMCSTLLKVVLCCDLLIFHMMLPSHFFLHLTVSLSYCLSRWVLWASRRTSKETARSLRSGTMAGKRFTSSRYVEDVWMRQIFHIAHAQHHTHANFIPWILWMISHPFCVWTLLSDHMVSVILHNTWNLF